MEFDATFSLMIIGDYKKLHSICTSMNMQFFTDEEQKCIRTFFKRSPAMHPINIRHPVQFADGMRSAAVPATPNAGAETPS